MNRLVLISLTAALAGSVVAQSNVVAGLDGRLMRIDNMTYYGRRGPAYPNGQIGMAMLNEMCNPGSVNIPWQAAMQPNHPKFGFMVVRVNNDKIEQINEWSFCKHAFTSINVTQGCGPCQNPGTGSLMGLNCSDTYGAGNNASRTWLGPPEEIDPWLGTWNPIGSYFDIGDPTQPGYPHPADGVRSLSQSIFDSVDNRVTINEVDLTTAGASYFYGLQLIHEGESVANRGDNLSHRGMSPSWNGSSWSFPNNGASEVYGSILDRWSGASVAVGQNGNDDGRYYVASKVTHISGNNYHYEYAIHNVDASRGGGIVRVPVATGVTASNFTFGDIDVNGSNDWTVAQVGNEVVFTAQQQNILEWNTIYNFGFDANRAPGAGVCRIDAARQGPGSAYTDIAAEVPGGVILANFDTYGAGCPGSVQLPPASCPQLNGTGGTLSNQTNQYEYCYRTSTSASIDVTSIEIYTASNSGTLTRPAHIYADNGGSPASAPLASTTITVNTAPGFYTATFASPVTVNGTFYVGYENSPGGIISQLTSGQNGTGFYRTAVTGNWSQSNLVTRPSFKVNCSQAPTFATPAVGNAGLPSLGGSYDVTLSDAVASSAAIIFTGLTDSIYNGLSLPYAIPGAPGCAVIAAPDVTTFTVTSVTGTSSSSFAILNDPAFIGMQMYHQWAILDAVNSIGIVVSDAGRALVGN